MLRIGIVAGEVSGDLLGANLIRDLKKEYPELEIVGIGGKELIGQGCKSLFAMEKLAVAGIFEVAGRLFELFNIRRQLTRYFIDNPPDVFIGVDAPDFNLTLEASLRRAGIKTVHYVGPSVWAWRQYRLKKIAKAVDLMLVLFPFEMPYFMEHNIAVECVGHPLVKKIPPDLNKAEARAQLGLPADKTMIALMPGSRRNELNRLAEPFLQAAAWCHARKSNLYFVANLVDEKGKMAFVNLAKQITPEIPIKVFTQSSLTVMQSSDVLLLASGTVTLEAMLLRKPMVVAYKFVWLTYQIGLRMARVQYLGWPNLLAKKLLVPECLQHDCTPERLGTELLKWLDDSEAVATLEKKLSELCEQLRQKQGSSAAAAVLSVVGK